MLRPWSELAADFAELAGEYRRVSMTLTQMALRCEAAGVSGDQVLDITFGSVASYVDGGAEALEQVASRLASSAGEGRTFTEGQSSLTAFPEAVSAHPSEALRRAALALEDAMNRALDLVEEVDDETLVGDAHPFGHIVQGICIPYILLAAQRLEESQR